MDKIYYISQGETPLEHLHAIEKVAQAGGELIQLRLKKVSDEVYLNTAIQAVEIGAKYGSKIIINDAIQLYKDTF